MTRRRPPNTVSKRFRRKLRRSRDPFMLWLRCKRPRVYFRLHRWRSFQLLNTLTHITPWETPFVSNASRVRSEHLYHSWVLDELKPEPPTTEITASDFDALLAAIYETGGNPEYVIGKCPHCGETFEYSNGFVLQGHVASDCPSAD